MGASGIGGGIGGGGEEGGAGVEEDSLNSVIYCF
jgi:hypothetical protein